MPTKLVSTHYCFGLMLMALTLAACAKRTPAPAIALASPTATTGATRTAAPMVTRTLSPTPSPTPSLTPTPTANFATIVHAKVTYVPSRTPTHTRTPAPTSTPRTPTATFLPTSTFAPSLTPATPLGPEAYQLKEWTAEEALAAVAEADGIVTQWDWATALYDYYDFANYFEDVEQEAVLRFPNISRQTGLTWKMGMQSADLRALWRPDWLVSYFVPALEDKLSSGAFKNCIFAQEGWKVISYSADNLFGDGEPVQVCHITFWFDTVATVIIKQMSAGKYEAVVLHDRWQYLYHASQDVSVTDRNGNGQPEIQVIENWYGSYGYNCESTLRLYEWQGKYPEGQFVNLGQNIKGVLESPSAGCDYNWEFTNTSSGAQAIIAIEPTYVAGTNCSGYELRTTYEWDGAIYRETSQQPNILDEKTLLACAVGWADWAGGRNDQALMFLKVAVEQWPVELDKTWGPAAQDYFRFKLGTWYALRGEDDLAQKTLEAVRDHPANTQYNMASRLARAFLANYREGHPFLACRTATNMLDNSNVIDFNEIYQQEGFLKAWGFSAPYWLFSAFNICNPADFLPTATQNLQSRATSDLYAWFREQQIPVWTIAESTLPDAGKKFWVALIRTTGQWELWAFLPTEAGLHPIFITSGYYPDTYFATLTPTLSKPGAFTFHLNGFNTTFHLSLKDEVWQVTEVGTVWDPATTKPRTPTQDERIIQVEALLFETGDIAGAQKELQKLLAGRVVEPDYYDALPRIRPRLLYLLGLTYELSGDEANAVQSYWQLWHDYPGNPYTFIARRKLVEVNG